ncbi:MAG: polysulfide reductase NrfD [Dehalococcoidales bacterium]|nr:polysulfide reductase NrfD [Dehalococcoidales bacterium]
MVAARLTEQAKRPGNVQSWIEEKIFAGQPFSRYCRGLCTPFNIVAAILVLPGLYLIATRFLFGLAAVTGASNEQPWGLFLGFGLFAQVPWSSAGFVLGTAVYVFGAKDYHPVVKNAVLIGFLGYLFAVVFLMVDLGRPWRIYYPMFISFGPASVMFLVAWHVALYLSVQFLEFSPSVFHWLGIKRLKEWAKGMTIGLTIFGIILSTLHQSALGAMFLLAQGKLHPLWYSPYLPWLFLVSAIATGISAVIVVSALTTRFMADRTDIHYLASINRITLGLSKAASFVLATYFAMKLIALAHGDNWSYLNSSYGYWYLIEMFGFVLAPCLLFAFASRAQSVSLVRFTAVLTVLGVLANRLTVSLVAFNWNLPEREIFNPTEAVIVVSVLTIEVLVYRWIVNRMPVLMDDPEHEEQAAPGQKQEERVPERVPVAAARH